MHLYVTLDKSVCSIPDLFLVCIFKCRTALSDMHHREAVLIYISATVTECDNTHVSLTETQSLQTGDKAGEHHKHLGVQNYSSLTMALWAKTFIFLAANFASKFF